MLVTGKYFFCYTVQYYGFENFLKKEENILIIDKLIL